jgi:hypothetical protein
VIRRVARSAALAAAAVDLAAAGLDWNQGGLRVPLHITAFVTALALAPCGLAFLAAIGAQLRRPASARGPVRTVDTIRLPLVVPRGYVGAAVLGGIATLAAMGEGFGLYIFLAGIALIALALSQAKPRSALAHR